MDGGLLLPALPPPLLLPHLTYRHAYLHAHTCHLRFLLFFLSPAYRILPSLPRLWFYIYGVSMVILTTWLRDDANANTDVDVNNVFLL